MYVYMASAVIMHPRMGWRQTLKWPASSYSYSDVRLVRFHTTITMDRDLILNVEKYASERGLSFSRAVEELVRLGLIHVKEMKAKERR